MIGYSIKNEKEQIGHTYSNGLQLHHARCSLLAIDDVLSLVANSVYMSSQYGTVLIAEVCVAQ